MKLLFSFLIAISGMVSLSVQACPSAEGDYSADIIVNRFKVGTITNRVHFSSGSSIRLELAENIKPGAGGAASFQFNDNFEAKVFRMDGDGYTIANRYVEPGEVISFNLKGPTFDQVNVQFVNGVVGRRPRSVSCGGPLSPVIN